jgi:Xaa-Pro aminopeptidase
MIKYMNEELEIKLSRIKNLLAAKSLDALLIQRVSNFAWLSCGSASYINTADEAGVAYLLVTPNGRYLITNNIEEPHFRNEENLEQQGWELKIAQWYQTNESIDNLTNGLRLGNDGMYPHGEDISSELIRLRADLLPIEQKRFRELSEGCAKAMKAAIYSIEPGMTEFEIAATLANEIQQKGILPIVNLIATDERIYLYRHPLPTHKQMEHFAMLVLCGRMDGLVASITRLVHFGPLPDELHKKSIGLANIDAYFITATRPGKSLSGIFAGAQAKYAEAGYPDEWQLHHQGGPAGYAPREAVATPDADWMVKEGQVFAWNPSISGTKSEDTILISGGGNEIMTEIPGWPEINVEIDGQVIPRPAILEIG